MAGFMQTQCSAAFQVQRFLLEWIGPLSSMQTFQGTREHRWRQYTSLTRQGLAKILLKEITSHSTSGFLCKEHLTNWVVERRIHAKIKKNTVLEAPVKKGQRVGTLTYYIDDEMIKEYPIITSENISKLTYENIFVKIAKKFLIFDMMG